LRSKQKWDEQATQGCHSPKKKVFCHDKTVNCKNENNMIERYKLFCSTNSRGATTVKTINRTPIAYFLLIEFE
jgi:hypothetical protein